MEDPAPEDPFEEAVAIAETIGGLCEEKAMWQIAFALGLVMGRVLAGCSVEMKTQMVAAFTRALNTSMHAVERIVVAAEEAKDATLQ